MHDNEEQKEKDEDTGPDLKVSSMFSTKSKSQVEPLTPKGRQQKMERKKTNPPNLLTRVVGCVSSPLSQRLEAAVDCRQTPDNWTAHILRDHSQSLVWHRVIKVNMPSCSGNRNLPGKIKLKSKPHKKTIENTDPDCYCLAYRESAQLEHLPTKPYQASAKGFSRLSWSCNKAFTLAACVSAWASSCPLSKGPWPNFSEILNFNLLGWVARLRYVVVTRLTALQLSRVKPQALDNSPSPAAPHSCSMGLPCRPGTTRPEFSKKTPYHRSCRVAWRRMLTSYAWLKMLREFWEVCHASTLRINSRLKWLSRTRCSIWSTQFSHIRVSSYCVKVLQWDDIWSSNLNFGRFGNSRYSSCKALHETPGRWDRHLAFVLLMDGPNLQNSRMSSHRTDKGSSSRFLAIRICCPA